MQEEKNTIDFATVLGSAVHDMKNSLSLLIQTIEDLGNSMPSKEGESGRHLASAHYEASRLNTGLMQLLSLYRAGLDNLPVSIDEHYMEDIVDELEATNSHYITHRKMSLEIECEEDIAWYLDADLICILLNDILINSMRYSKHEILLRVYQEREHLVFQVEDDGPGYPQSMLDANSVDMQCFDISQGRTGLGLFFARLIAQAHANGDRHGVISMHNGGRYGGSVFTLKLP